MSSPNGAALIEKLTAHFADLRKERRSVKLPQLSNNGHCPKIFFKPLNCLERDELQELIMQEKYHEACARAFFLKAEDEDGVAMFQRNDKAELRALNVRADPEIVKTVGMAILGHSTVPDSDELGNS